MIRFISIVVLCFITQFGFSQEFITSRLRIESGGSIYFNFNSLDKYNSGIEYKDWTRVSVYFMDTLANGDDFTRDWQLTVKANDSDFTGDAGNSMTLDKIEISTTGSDAGATYIPYALPIALTDFEQAIVTNGTQALSGTSTLRTVSITYRCGQSISIPNNGMLGKKPDYYAVDLILTLKPQ